MRFGTTFGCFLICVLKIVRCVPQPVHVWPFNDNSGLADVALGADAEDDDDDSCYVMGPSYPTLPGGSISVSKTDQISMKLKDNIFEDMSISLMVYPTSDPPSGILLQYFYKGVTKLMLNFVHTTTIVSVRDEFDFPAGMVTVEDAVVANQWNLIVVQRRFSDGEVSLTNVVYMDKNVTVRDNTGTFENMAMPGNGLVIVGSGEEENPLLQFSGHINCVQVYASLLTDDDIKNLWKACLSINWILLPPMYLVPSDSNPSQYCLEERQSLTDDPSVVSITTLTNENKWVEACELNGWSPSNNMTIRYFKLKSRDMKPSPVVSLLGKANATSPSVCSRLCMRVEDCTSFYVDQMRLSNYPCYLFSSVTNDLVSGVGAKYYAVV